MNKLSQLLKEKQPIAYFGRYCQSGRFTGFYEFGYITEINGVQVEYIVSRSR